MVSGPNKVRVLRARTHLLKIQEVVCDFCIHLTDRGQPLQLHMFIWTVRVTPFRPEVYALDAVFSLEYVGISDSVGILVEGRRSARARMKAIE